MTDQARVVRGTRLKEIREALGLDQGQLAERLTEVAGRLGLPQRYSSHLVSVKETGRVGLKIEDYAAIGFLDPERWSWMWLAFGKELEIQPRVSRPRPTAASAKRAVGR